MKKVMIGMMVLAVAAFSCKSEGSTNEAPSTTTSEVSEVTSEHAGAIHITKADFLDQIMNYEENPTEWVFKGDKPGLVDFYADWCRPCKITGPILDELAVEYAGKINIYKVDVDSEKELAGLFGIQSIPSFLYMPMKGQPTMSSGIAQTPEQTKEMFRQQIEEILLKNGEM